MTNEQREAINRLEDLVELRRSKTGTIKYDNCICGTLDLDTALSLIKEQQEKIAKYEKIYKEYDCYRWVKELNKKDNQIDLMAKEITMTKPTPCTRTNEFSMGRMYMSKEEIKQYFADLVEKEN